MKTLTNSSSCRCLSRSGLLYMLQREGSGKLINTSDDETAGHNGNRIYGCTRRHPKKFQIALGIIYLSSRVIMADYILTPSADRLTLTKTHCAAMDLHASRHMRYTSKRKTRKITQLQRKVNSTLAATLSPCAVSTRVPAERDCIIKKIRGFPLCRVACDPAGQCSLQGSPWYRVYGSGTYSRCSRHGCRPYSYRIAPV